MKGIILAGGKGTRLRPLTKITNKHLLPVYNRPMIEYPIDTLKHLGFNEIVIVTGKESAGDFMNYLGSGKEYGLKFYYCLQDEAGGIAEALATTEGICKKEPVVVILGDNIFEWTVKIKNSYKKWKNNNHDGAVLFLKEVSLDEAKRFGVAVVDRHKKTVRQIVEKPDKPLSNLVQTGLYFYDKDVYQIIRGLKKSARGELEIADVSDSYCKREKARYTIINSFWSDAGTFESLLKVTEFIRLKSNY